MYSLWRGTVLLGRITPELPGETADAVFGVLDASAEFFPGEALSQTTMLDWPGSPVFQHVQEHSMPNVTGEHRQVASVGARPLAQAVRGSVPADRQLTLRDVTHSIVPTRTIAIMAIARGTHRIQQLCHDAGVVFSGWCVIAALADPVRDTL